MPSVMDLMGASYSDFNGEYLPLGLTEEDLDSLSFTVKVYNAESQETLECATTDNCLLRYHRDYTPQMLDITPSNVARGSEMQMHFNAKNAHTTSVTAEDDDPFRTLHLGLVLLDVDGLIEEADRLKTWTHDTLSAIVTDGYCTDDTEPRILF